MENLKTYRIDSDIASQSLNPAKLSNEINDSLSVNGLEAINTEGNFFHIIGTSIENESSLDQVVNEHVSSSQSDDLLSEYVKYEKDGKKYFNEIRARLVSDYHNGTKSSLDIYTIEDKLEKVTARVRRGDWMTAAYELSNILPEDIIDQTLYNDISTGIATYIVNNYTQT